MSRKSGTWGVAVLTLAALAVTFLWPFEPPLPTFEAAGPPPTPRAWKAAPALLAGSGVRGWQDGTADRARFADPWGVALPGDGSVLVADAGDNNRIRRITLDGRVETLAGGVEGFRDGTGAEARFHTPSGLALDLAGNLYVADTGNHAIRKVTPDGRVTTLAGTGQPGYRDGAGADAMFDGPMGVAVDASGRVLVADTYNDRIRVIDPHGRVGTLAGDGTPGMRDGPGWQARFDTPTGIAVDVRGRAWVADAGNGLLRQVQPNGQVATLLSDMEATPMALARSHDGVLYASTVWPGAIWQQGANGHWTRVLELPPGHRMSRPAGIAVGLDGALTLADAGAYRVHRLAAPIARPWPTPPAESEVPGEARVHTAPRPLTVPGPIGPDPATPLPDTGGRWPLHPQQGWHEVVGTLGEVRGDYHGESRHHLHAGLDIRGDVGQPVLAMSDAKISQPLAAWNPGGLGEGLALDELNYIHMRVGRRSDASPLAPSKFRMVESDTGALARVRVRRGTRFEVGEPLGTINRMAHVHLEVGSSGFQRNAAVLGFTGFVDTVPPRIDRIELLDASGAPLPVRDGRVDVPRDGVGLQLVVEAWDQVDDNLPRRRLGLYALGYALWDAAGRPVPGHSGQAPRIEFDRMPQDREAVKLAYAEGSGITVHGSAVTRFRYDLGNTVRNGVAEAGQWQVGDLAPGDYTLRVHARDYAGNAAHGVDTVALRIQ